MFYMRYIQSIQSCGFDISPVSPVVSPCVPDTMHPWQPMIALQHLAIIMGGTMGDVRQILHLKASFRAVSSPTGTLAPAETVRMLSI